MTLQEFVVIPDDTVISNATQAGDATLAGMPTFVQALDAAGFNPRRGDPATLYGFTVDGSILEYLQLRTVCCEIDSDSVLVFSFGGYYTISNSKLKFNELHSDIAYALRCYIIAINKYTLQSTLTQTSAISIGWYSTNTGDGLRSIIVINNKIIRMVGRDSKYVGLGSSSNSYTLLGMKLANIFESGGTGKMLEILGRSGRTGQDPFIVRVYNDGIMRYDDYSSSSSSIPTFLLTQSANLTQFSLTNHDVLYGQGDEDSFVLGYSRLTEVIYGGIEVINGDEYYVYRSMAIRLTHNENS